MKALKFASYIVCSNCEMYIVYCTEYNCLQTVDNFRNNLNMNHDCREIIMQTF